MNNDNFLIEESDLEQARSIARVIKDSNLRNRAVANALAAALTSKYFVDAEVDTETGLYHIAQILEELDISDIYIKENYIDVRFYFSEKDLYVPKSHFDRNILPVAYMFIKLEEDLAGGLVSGFIPSSSVDTSNEVNGYYEVSEDDLVSFYDVDSMIVQDHDIEIPDSFETELFDFLDNKLEDRDSFFRLLLSSSEARKRVIDAAKAKAIFNVISLDVSKQNSENAPVDVNDEELSLTAETPELSLEVSDDLGLEDVEVLEEDSADELVLAEESESFELEETDELVEEVEELTLGTDDSLGGLGDGLELDSEEDSLIEFGSDLSPAEDVTLDEFDGGLELAEADSLLEADSNDLIESVDTDLPAFDIDLNAEDQSNITSDDDSHTIQEEVADEDSLGLVIPDSDSISMLGVGEIESPKIESLTETTDSGLEKSEELTITAEDNDIVDLAAFVEDSEGADSADDVEEMANKTNDSSSETIVVTEEDSVSQLEFADDVKVEEQADGEFDFTTNTTPSIDSIENEEVNIDELENMLENEVPNTTSYEQVEQAENSEEIDGLFSQEEIQPVEGSFTTPQKKGSPLVPLLGLILLGVGGYFGYTKYFAQPTDSMSNSVVPNKTVEVVNKVQTNDTVKATPKKETPVAMPVETIENVKAVNNTNEGNAVSIPAIETNLDASVLVSNLSVNWEVPASYVSNSTAKRYFTKIGKIIQLNLKTELLLLSNPPITNKITLELEFNNDAGKFVVKSMLESSGEKTVDEIIKTTVTKALDMKLSTNMSTFSNVSGNPVLVIRL